MMHFRVPLLYRHCWIVACARAWVQFPNNAVPNVEWQEVNIIISAFSHNKVGQNWPPPPLFKVWKQSVGPGPRTGHTLNLRKDSKVVLFGGRGNDLLREHIPRTYEITREVKHISRARKSESTAFCCFRARTTAIEDWRLSVIIIDRVEPLNLYHMMKDLW